MADEEQAAATTRRGRTPLAQDVWETASRAANVAGMTKVNEGIEGLRGTVDSLHSSLTAFASDLRSASAALRDIASTAGASSGVSNSSHTSGARGSSNSVNSNAGFKSYFQSLSPTTKAAGAGFALGGGLSGSLSGLTSGLTTAAGAGIGFGVGGPPGAIIGGIVGNVAGKVTGGVTRMITGTMGSQLEDALANRPGLLTFGALNGLQGYNAGYGGSGAGQDTYRTAGNMLKNSALFKGGNSLNATDLTAAGLQTTYFSGGLNNMQGRQFQNAIVQIARGSPGLGDAGAASFGEQLYGAHSVNALRLFGLSPVRPGGGLVSPNTATRDTLLHLGHFAPGSKPSNAELGAAFADNTPNFALLRSIYGEQGARQFVNLGITGGVGGKDKLSRQTLANASNLTGQQLDESSSLQSLFTAEVKLSGEALIELRKITSFFGKTVGKAAHAIAHSPVGHSVAFASDLLHGDFSGAFGNLPAVQSFKDFSHGDITGGIKSFFGFGDPPSNAFQGRINSSDGASAVTGMKPAFESKLAAMFQANPKLRLNSGFRSSGEQKAMWDAAVKQFGSAAEAAKHVAPPGTSLHEQGVAADIGPASEYGWLKANASKYGLTGFASEPWHFELAGARAGAFSGEDTSNSMTTAGVATKAGSASIQTYRGPSAFASESELLGLSTSEFGGVMKPAGAMSSGGGSGVGGMSASGGGSTSAAAGPSKGGGTYDAFARAVLAGIGAPINANTLNAMADWFAGEEPAGKGAKFNPMNTTRTESGATNFNSIGVKNYTSWQQGVQATIDTLNNGRYGSILQALRSGATTAAIDAAINGSPWGTHDASPHGQAQNSAYLGARVVGDPPSPMVLSHSRSNDRHSVTHNWTIKIDRVDATEARRLYELFKSLDAKDNAVEMVGSN